MLKQLRSAESKPRHRDVLLMRGISAPGHISVEEAQFLGELVQQTNAEEPIIEIGTLFGFSTLVLTMFKQQSQPLISVDNFSWNPLGISREAHLAATQTVLADAQRFHNVTLRAEDKESFYSNFKGPRPGLFFCDADHSYEATKRDLLWARSVGARIVAGHDYDPERAAGVVRAVEEMGGVKQRRGSIFVL